MRTERTSQIAYAMVPEANVYRGFTPSEWRGAYDRDTDIFTRGIHRYLTNDFSVDTLVSRRIQRAREEGRRDVTILDLGGGNGNFVRQFMTDISASGETRKVLQSGPDTTVQFYSITDAARPQEHLMEKNSISFTRTSNAEREDIG